MEQINTIKRNEIINMINTNPNRIFGMTYIKADGSLRTASGKLHVFNPAHCLKPGTGLYQGESFKHALEVNNNLKYFDMNVEGNGGKGGFRTAKIDNIRTLTVNGIQYTVID